MSDLVPEVMERLLLGRLGRPYRFVDSCPSTQRLLADGDPEGAVAAADHQTEGRGRLGRSWLTPPGRAILCSVLLRPEPPVAVWPQLSLAAGRAVAVALGAETGLAVAVAHPNDVLVESRKVAGILAEASSGRVVLGVGVNVNQTPEELPTGTPKAPTSLRVELGHELDRARLLAAILLELEREYDAWSAHHRR